MFSEESPTQKAGDLHIRTAYFLSPAPQAVPQAAGLPGAPQAVGLSGAPQAEPGIPFHADKLESAMIFSSVTSNVKQLFPACNAIVTESREEKKYALFYYQVTFK